MAVRATPFGPMSNIQPMTTAIGKPSATSTITRVTDQDGRFSAGSTTEAISITIQPATAYSTSTRITRLRLRPAKKPSPASTSDPPPIIKPPCGKGRRLVVRPFSERYSSHGGRGALRGIQGFPSTPRLGVDSHAIQNLHRRTRLNHRFLLSAALLAFIGTAPAQQQAPPTQQATQQQATQQQARPAQQQLTPQQQAQLAKQNSAMSKAALTVMKMLDGHMNETSKTNTSATHKRLDMRSLFANKDKKTPK